MEADSLLTLLTKKKGKLTAIAKGVRKPNSRLRGGVQLFTYNDILLHEGRNLDIVTQSQSLEAFTLMQEDIKALAAAAYWSELLDALTVDGEADLDIFNLALAGFHVLSLSTTELTIRALEIKLLAIIGFAPCLDRCAGCGETLNNNKLISFSSRKGGVLCQACTNIQGINSAKAFSYEALNIWQQLQKMDLEKTGRVKITLRGSDILEKSIGDFLMEQIEYPLKSRSIMKEMIQDK
jgi:DNA repair protein RecO (recombination protein O)